MGYVERVIEEYENPSDVTDVELATRAREAYAEQLKEMDRLKARAAKSEAAYLQLQSKLDESQHELEQLRADMAQFSEEMGLPPGIRPAPGELRRLFAELTKLTELRSLLSSGQCVDLAKLSEITFARIIQVDGQSIDEAIKEARDVRMWLIEDAGVNS